MAARANCLSFAVKEACGGTAARSESDMKRVARYVRSEGESVFSALVDSDWAEC